MPRPKKSAEKIEAVPLSDTEETISELVVEMGIKEFEDPMGKDMAKLEADTAAYVARRDENDVELSFHLYAIESRAIYAEHGMEKKDYYERVLNISVSKANEMTNNVEMLVAFGISNVKKLVGLSWAKVKQLRSLVVNGVINNKSEMDEWLKKCAVSGRKMLTLTSLNEEIKEEIAKVLRKSKDENKRKKISFDIDAHHYETLLQFEEIAKKELETEDRGSCYVIAAAEYAGVHSDAADAAKHRHLSLANLKILIETIAPVTAVFIPARELKKDELGILPIYCVYQGYAKVEDKEELVCCIAPNAAEAKIALGVKEVREFPLMLAASMEAKKPFKAPESASLDTEQEAKPKAKGKPKAEKKVAKEHSEPTEKKPSKEASQEDVKTEITTLVKKLGISSEIYNKKRGELSSRLSKEGKATGLNSAILEWLRSETSK